MDRREAIRRIGSVLGGSLSAPTLAGLLAGCEAGSPGVDFTPRTLSPDQASTVDLIAEMILPATDTPGASAAGVPAFIDDMLTDYYGPTDRNLFVEALGSVERVSARRFGVAFSDASPADRHKVLTVLDREAFPDPIEDPEGAEAVAEQIRQGRPPFMRVMKELTVSGYYTSAIGQTEELHRPPFGPFQADVPLDQVGRSWA